MVTDKPDASNPEPMGTRSATISAGELLRLSRSRAVIFDMDGVLADTEKFHVEAWIRLVEGQTGKSPATAVVRSTFGMTNDLILPVLWRHVGATLDRGAEEMGALKERLYREAAAGRVQPLPGVERFIEWLKGQGVPTAIGTSGPRENIEFLVHEFGWTGCFDVLVDRRRFAAGKPAADCFLCAARELSIAPAEALVFEDSFHGLIAARRGGFSLAAIASTHPPSALRPQARWVFRDFLDVAC
jgi:beta-phosphoglucomutase